jgi:hypothetical protein
LTAWAAIVSAICVGATLAETGVQRPTVNARSLKVSDSDTVTVKRSGGGLTNLPSAPAQVRLNALSSDDQDKIRRLLRTKGAFPAPTRSDSPKYDLTGEVDGETRTVRVPEELVPFSVRSLVKTRLPDR